MYINLDLLYNVDNYLFPLFYNPESEFEVYSPMTNKGIFIWGYLYLEKGLVLYYDYKTNVCLDDKSKTYIKKTINFNEKSFKKFNPCKSYKSYKLSKKDINFLKSNTRLQLN